MKNGGRALLHLGAIFATVVSEAVRQNFQFLKNILFPATSKQS